MITNNDIIRLVPKICKIMKPSIMVSIVENKQDPVPKYLEMGIRFNIHTGCIETNIQIINKRFSNIDDHQLIIAIGQEIRQADQYYYLWNKIGKDGTKVLCMNPKFRSYLSSDAGASAVNAMLQITSGKPAEFKPLEILLSDEVILNGFRGLHFTNNRRK